MQTYTQNLVSPMRCLKALLLSSNSQKREKLVTKLKLPPSCGEASIGESFNFLQKTFSRSSIQPKMSSCIHFNNTNLIPPIFFHLFKVTTVSTCCKSENVSGTIDCEDMLHGFGIHLCTMFAENAL